MAKSVKLEGPLWDRIVAASAKAGYSSPEELVQNAVEKELAKLEAEEPVERLEERLKGLGYIE